MSQPSFNPAKRSLGQNFLIDSEVVERITSALGTISGRKVLEIGPGRGALTDKLIADGAVVTVIEKDTAIAEHLRKDCDLHVVEADFLSLDLPDLFSTAMQEPVKLIGNLPYNVATAILEKIGIHRGYFSDVVLMFQREVAARIVAGPSTPERGLLSVLSQSAFDIEKLFDVAPVAFRPQPKVWSSVVRFRPKPRNLCDEEGFRKLVSIGFSQRRKTLVNNLKAVTNQAETWLAEAGIDGARRAETLTLEEWQRLFITRA